MTTIRTNFVTRCLITKAIIATYYDTTTGQISAKRYSTTGGTKGIASLIKLAKEQTPEGYVYIMHTEEPTLKEYYQMPLSKFIQYADKVKVTANNYENEKGE